MCIQIFDCLQKLGLCLSHRGTINVVDKLGIGFDKRVLQWKEEIEASMNLLDSVVSYETLCSDVLINNAIVLI